MSLCRLLNVCVCSDNFSILVISQNWRFSVAYPLNYNPGKLIG